MKRWAAAIAILLVLSYVAASQQHLFGALDRANSWLATQTFTAIVDSGLAPATVICTDANKQLTTSGCPAPGGGVTGSGASPRVAVFSSASVIASAANIYDDGSNAVLCNGTFPTCTGPYIFVSALTPSGSVVIKSPSGQILLDANTVTSGIDLRSRQGSFTFEAGAGVQPTLALLGGTSGQVNLTVDATSNNQTINLNSLAMSCGTTTTCSNSRPGNPRMLWGRVTLSGGTATVASISPTFSNNNSSECTAEDRTTFSNPASAVIASTSSITVTGTGTDVIAYHCIGN